MISEFLIFSILFLLLLKYLWIKFTNEPKKQPPGPWKLPILGHLPLLGFYPYKKMLEWTGKYGPIISVQFGSISAIVLNDTASIKSVFNLPSISGRPNIKYFDELTMNRSGLGWADGPAWKEIRQFTKRKFKDSGYGGARMEAQIQEQVPKLLEIFETHLGRQLEVNDTFGVVTLEYIWGIINGSDETRDEREFQKFTQNLMKVGTVSPIFALSVFLPQLPSWFSKHCYTQKREEIEGVHNYIQKAIKMHRETHVGDAPRDVIDQFLDQEKTSPRIFTNNALQATLLELLVAGSDSSTSTLGWLLFYLVKHPEIQDKLAREIQASIPITREAKFSDRNNMPYFEAIFNETLRISPVFPLGIFHSALEDTEFQGFLIKKDTMVIGNVYASQHDPSIWEDPMEFKPERFLGEDGQLNDAVSKVLAFSTGKRKCIGEILARNQVFLFAVNIFRRYKLKPFGPLPSGRSSTIGFSQSCEPFLVRVSRRP